MNNAYWNMRILRYYSDTVVFLFDWTLRILQTQVLQSFGFLKSTERPLRLSKSQTIMYQCNFMNSGIHAYYSHDMQCSNGQKSTVSILGLHINTLLVQSSCQNSPVCWDNSWHSWQNFINLLLCIMNSCLQPMNLFILVALLDHIVFHISDYTAVRYRCTLSGVSHITTKAYINDDH